MQLFSGFLLPIANWHLFLVSSNMLQEPLSEWLKKGECFDHKKRSQGTIPAVTVSRRVINTWAKKETQEQIFFSRKPWDLSVAIDTSERSSLKFWLRFLCAYGRES